MATPSEAVGRSFWNRLSSRPVVRYGAALAEELARLYPRELDHAGKSRISADRLARILEGIYAKAQAFHAEHKLGWYRQARLAHAFKWRLLELGYSKPLIEAATEGLVVYLKKPRIDTPELAKAQEKRVNNNRPPKN